MGPKLAGVAKKKLLLQLGIWKLTDPQTRLEECNTYNNVDCRYNKYEGLYAEKHGLE